MLRLQTSGDRKPVIKGGRLPEFFAVGPPRTATTWLYFVLKNHVNLPELKKEVEFYDSRYAKGVAWYQRHFQRAVAGLPLGDIAPTYFYSAPARRRIASLIPKARIICTLRDPIDRAYSLYKLKWSSGALRCSFARAMESDFEMIESSRYAFHLAEWLRMFGKERVLVLMHEELIDNPRDYLRKVCEFLGIPMIDLDESDSGPTNVSEQLPSPTLPYWTDFGIRAADSLQCNGYLRTMAWVRRLGLRRLFISSRASAVPPLDRGYAQELRQRMRAEIEALETLLDADLSIWKTGSRPRQSKLVTGTELKTG
jgi:hypothetical protein